MTHLLDVNVLLALAWPAHVHHAAAQDWFRKKGRRGWSTCPLTETAFVRISSNPKFTEQAVSPGEAVAILQRAIARTKHEFWPDEFSVAECDRNVWTYCLGHRQVTNAYLLDLARRKAGKLATLDAGISSLLPDRSERGRFLEVIAA